jgi:hypothetical protein
MYVFKYKKIAPPWSRLKEILTLMYRQKNFPDKNHNYRPIRTTNQSELLTNPNYRPIRTTNESELPTNPNYQPIRTTNESEQITN